VSDQDHRYEYVLARDQEGFFDDVGLDVQPVLLRGSSITLQTLVSESLYLALDSGDSWMGILHNESHLASQCGDQSRRVKHLRCKSTPSRLKGRRRTR
jgi:hypothetical protein